MVHKILVKSDMYCSKWSTRCWLRVICDVMVVHEMLFEGDMFCGKWSMRCWLRVICAVVNGPQDVV